MEQKEMTFDYAAQKEFIINKFNEQGDFQQLEGFDISAAVETAQKAENAYMEALGDAVYDDEAAYQAVFTAISSTFEEFKMYAMRFTDDYLDFSEEYMESAGLIDWE